MKLQNTKGFTLIELLVVITIIGILATGAVATYTSQIQKARDTTRVNDLKAVESAVQQFYGDESVYPDTVNSGSLGNYIGRIPQDSKYTSAGVQWATASGSTDTSWENWNLLQYGYNVGPLGSVPKQRFELSTAFENQSNADKKASSDADNGNEPNRFEIWVPWTGGTLNLTTEAGKYESN